LETTVTAQSLEQVCQLDALAVRAQLDRILKSEPFHQSPRRQKFLQYLVEETLAGRGDRLKGYPIAIEVFERPASFDPLVDPVVRVEAGRLRDKLREYYDNQGRNDPVVIELRKGGYAPHITMRGPGADAELSEAARPGELPSDGEVAAETPPAGLTDAARWGLPAVGALLAGLLAVAVLLWGLGGSGRHGLPEQPSIAVLPFDNFGRDPQWQRFADGMTEDIIADLAQSRDMIVIARNSTSVYRDKPVDVRQIGRDLNVRYVLEGSLQPVGERIRVTAQLIDAGTGGHVWSERFDRHADDFFAVQDELTQRIAATLIGYQGAVAEAERSRLRRKSPASLSAYDTYLLGIEAKHKATAESLVEAEALLHRALEIDPKLARAYSGLANVQYYRVDLGLTTSVSDAVREMAQAGAKAVELDPNDGLSHQALGMAYGYQGKIEQSRVELNKAVALAPSNADLLLIVAWSLPQLGESERAVTLADRALILNPHYPDWYNQGFGVIYLFGKQYEKAVKYRLLVKEPVAIDHAFLAIGWAHMGRMAEATASAQKVKALDPAWVAERYLSETGGYPDREADIFVEGARKAGIGDCVAADRIGQMPELRRVASCDRLRAGSAPAPAP
jgi:TolB-like protein/Flp pilus assembly protein TadD